MKEFTHLFTRLDQTTKTNSKVSALAEYFTTAGEDDRLWAIAILSHRRPKRPVNTTQLKEWAASYSELPFWLLDESHHVVGDLAETIALLLPDPVETSDHSLTYWITYLTDMRRMTDQDKEKQLIRAWSQLDRQERFVFNKLITGGFRMGVSQKLMVRALAAATGIDESLLAHRLMGNWVPSETTFGQLILTGDQYEDISRPYPFYLAYALEEDPSVLGDPQEWQAEYKWDGIRGQLIIRKGQMFVWSRGEELVTDKYPEYEKIREQVPDGTVLDGEILPFREGKPLPFSLLQTRIGRKNLTAAILKKAPVIFKAYDLLEWEGKDIRPEPLHIRRSILEKLASHAPEVLHISPTITYASWEELARERETARTRQTEGIMLKNLSSPYRDGRRRGDWWKWKVDPLTIDAVLIYAMRGHGRRANLYTDYTFAVWKDDQLIPFTKAYSGLTDKELVEVDRFVKRNTIERFGPVRSVTPQLVFEIAFEGINRSTRHKSGVALRFPRIKRWRLDKPMEEANTLDDLHELLENYG